MQEIKKLVKISSLVYNRINMFLKSATTAGVFLFLISCTRHVNFNKITIDNTVLYSGSCSLKEYKLKDYFFSGKFRIYCYNGIFPFRLKNILDKTQDYMLYVINDHNSAFYILEYENAGVSFILREDFAGNPEINQCLTEVTEFLQKNIRFKKQHQN